MNDISLTFPWATLIEWYKEHGRHDLEWRDYSMSEPLRAYRVWLSEIFLQQTQVERVRGYFRRVLEAYPTLDDLARASYDEFFPYYQGMGYYSRARNLLATASRVSELYDGEFPREKSLLEKLPGVGSYTSSAILAFAFGEPYLAWDTNLEKVFARYYHGSRMERLSEEEKKNIEEDFRDFIARHCDVGSNPENKKRISTDDWIGSSLAMTEQDMVRAINNALMDFAATVDLKNPDTIDWEGYPIQAGVFYETRGSLEPREMKRSQTFPTPDAKIILILHKDHKEYLSLGAREDTPLSKEDIEWKKALPKNMSHLLQRKVGNIPYHPFILAPSLSRDTRAYIQKVFRETYGLELSVRPPTKKWIGDDGVPYILINAQIQTGTHDFIVFEKK